MIRLIRDDDDHAKALARVDAIFTAKPDSPEFEELIELTALIEAYKREHDPIDPPR